VIEIGGPESVACLKLPGAWDEVDNAELNIELAGVRTLQHDPVAVVDQGVRFTITVEIAWMHIQERPLRLGVVQ
jgi:hypothetical protein